MAGFIFTGALAAPEKFRLNAGGEAPPDEISSENGGHKSGFAMMTLGSLGVVYGDIGTSPLYAMREAIRAARADGILTHSEIFGAASLILWALIIIVTVKYVLFLLRVDNRGEGGTLSLMAKARRLLGKRGSATVFAFGVIAAALFYGDAIITPSISVLSSVEGLHYVTGAASHHVLVITAAILIALFAVQSYGTARVAGAFGPITLLWFLTLGGLGVLHIAATPVIFAAFNPYYSISYLATHGSTSLVTLGAVFLAVTGAEALYADLGHFGRKPIQTAWFAVVLPALTLNYLGQAALMLKNPAAAADPFFMMAPGALLAPVVALATIATIIASQAVITGAYSMTQQAIHLGLLPRLQIQHTSAKARGQIFMPQVNLLLFIGCMILVFSFRSSSALASAYGIAVTGTMIVTAMLAFVILWKGWNWPIAGAAAFIAPFLVTEIVFLNANLLKIAEGGWLPLALATTLMLVMWSWSRGSSILHEKSRRSHVPLMEAIRSIEASDKIARVDGTAVFLTSDPQSAPSALMHNLKHNRVLHENNVILNIRHVDLPHIARNDRVSITRISDRFQLVQFDLGYMDRPHVPTCLEICRKKGWTYEIMKTSFFLSRRWLKSDPKSGMPGWQDSIFLALARNATTATDYFSIPTDRVIEIGTQMTV